MSGTARKFKKKNLIPWPHHWGHGVRKDGLHYRAWMWRGKLITPAKAVR
jgi:hypothetical protein